MSKRNEYAREQVYTIIAEAFSKGFVGVQDKKIYVNVADDTGEIIQFAIAITQPKVPIGASPKQEQSQVGKSSSNEMNWEDSSSEIAPKDFPQEEQEKVLKLMNLLGI